MSGALDPRTPVSDVDRIGRELDAIQRRLDNLEAPSGTSAFRSVEKLTALVNDIQAQLDAWTSTRYTNSQIDSKLASPGAIAPTTVTTSSNVYVGGTLRVPDAVTFNITGTRRAMWIEDATGRAGYASSTERVKASIRPADPEKLLRILDVAPVTFLYRPEILRRVNLRATYGIDYMPARELGLIAEHLDAAGLSEFVIYDADGEVEGIEYSMLTVALLGVARVQRDAIVELRSDVAEIRAALGVE